LVARRDGARLLLLGDERLELLRCHDLNGEQHPGVVEPAELGALAAEGPEPRRRDVDRVLGPRDDVALLEELRDIERVDHIG
jgi:hypothetical protein